MPSHARPRPPVDPPLALHRHAAPAPPRQTRRRLLRSVLLLLGLVFLPCCGDSATAPHTRSQRFTRGNVTYAVVFIDLRTTQLGLTWRAHDGTRVGSFEKAIQSARPSRVLFATNSGIFDPAHTPCGWHVENGRELVPLNLRDGEGNFYLKPNGVFLLDSRGARIVDSRDAVGAQHVSLAVQSGPLLLLAGQLHPRLAPGSTSKVIRSGVGVVSPSEVCFALSEQPVNFHDFAEFFKTQLGCREALYLDGAISKFYAPQLGLTDRDGDFAGILTAVEPAH